MTVRPNMQTRRLGWGIGTHNKSSSFVGYIQLGFYCSIFTKNQNIIEPSFAFFFRAKVPPSLSKNDSSFFFGVKVEVLGEVAIFGNSSTSAEGEGHLCRFQGSIVTKQCWERLFYNLLLLKSFALELKLKFH